MQPDDVGGLEVAPNFKNREVAADPGRESFPLGLRPDQEFDAVVGASVLVRGLLSFAGSVRIEGSVNGEIAGGELVVIANRANIRGTIRARTVIVLGGAIEGDIFAENSIELRVPCSVQGNLTAPEVFLDRGVDFRGQCFMKRAD